MNSARIIETPYRFARGRFILCDKLAVAGLVRFFGIIGAVGDGLRKDAALVHFS